MNGTIRDAGDEVHADAVSEVQAQLAVRRWHAERARTAEAE